MPVLESPMSPPEHERGPSVDTPILQPTSSDFHASYHVQNTVPYQNVSEVRYTGCMVCGRSVDSIKDEKVKWYMQRSTPRDEPETRHMKTDLMLAVFLSHPQCRRLPPVTVRQ